MAKPNKNNSKSVSVDKDTEVAPVIEEVVEEVIDEPTPAVEPVAVMDEPVANIEPVVEDDPRWPLDVWHQVAQNKIGQPSHVLTAAMMGQDQDAQYSEPEVRRLVEKFLNTPAR